MPHWPHNHLAARADYYRRARVPERLCTRTETSTFGPCLHRTAQPRARTPHLAASELFGTALGRRPMPFAKPPKDCNLALASLESSNATKRLPETRPGPSGCTPRPSPSTRRPARRSLKSRKSHCLLAELEVDPEAHLTASQVDFTPEIAPSKRFLPFAGMLASQSPPQ